MLNVFKHNKDPKALRNYRTAYIKEDSGDKAAFKYFLVDREDAREADFLKGIEMQTYTKIIKTSFSYDFTIKTKIIIDNIQYSVNSLYTEQQEQANGMFRNVKNFTYLVLNK